MESPMKNQQDQKERYEEMVQSQRAGSILGSKIASQGLPPVGNKLTQPRKFIVDQISQANSALSELFEACALLEQRLACVIEVPGTGIGCSAQQPQSSEPPHVEALDSIIERLHVARLLINSMTERVRV